MELKIHPFIPQGENSQMHLKGFVGKRNNNGK